ncbi:helix-turn-helix domain-containing protein [Paenibacillus sp. FSL L8-0708]|uniref:helix-turn-helix domain-containing protein n=1 Tax=Paenibacillus sp. FSL L8-0708 TaxID=2975311 RepID=UPI0030F4D46D
MNTLGRSISKKERQEAAIRLREEGKSERKIAEWLGISQPTAHRWVSAVIPVDSNESRGKMEASDGKAYDFVKATAETLTEREETALRLREEGRTLKEIALAIGVSSPQTASNTLARAESKRVELAEEPDEEETHIPAKPAIDPRIFELIEYSARTAAEVKDYGDLPLGPDRSLLRFFHESLRPFVGNLSMSAGDYTRATDEMAKELYMEQLGFMAEISLRMLIEHDYSRAEKIMEAIANE